MADTVQYKLERMVDELEDLEKRGLFNRGEISEIVKQRRKFEYRLKRPSPLKQDFLAYIEYETQLDNLRRLRKKCVARELKKKGNRKMKVSVSDFAGVSRIVEIYRLAVMRYKGDIELWFKYLEFCREKRNGRMKKILAQVIRFHPKVPGIWIYAAAWEFDHNLNVAAARALMQSGLRVCPSSEDLWVEYLRMELTYLNKLKARKVALGEDKGSLVRQNADEKQWRDGNKDLFMSLDEDRGTADGTNVGDEESESKVDIFREQGLSILQTIYDGAVEALPSSFGLRKRLLGILEAIDLAYSEDMREKILSDMKRDFSNGPQYWDWLARLEMDSQIVLEATGGLMPEQLQKAIKVYEEGLQVVSSPVMFNLYIKFLMDVSAPKGEENQQSKLPSHYVLHLLTVYEKAEIMGCITEDLACQYVSFYLQLARLEEARKLAEKLCSGELADSVKLRGLRASLEMRCFTKSEPGSNEAELLSIFELLESLLTKMSILEAQSLWTMALKFFANEKQYIKKLIDMSLVSVAKYGGGDDGFSLPSAILHFVLQQDGIQQARDTYRRFLALPRPGLVLYRHCIEWESNLASIGDKDCLSNARKLYDTALITYYDQDVSLWRDYYAMEIKLGTSETASAVYWRARKTIRNFARFVSSPDSL